MYTHRVKQALQKDLRLSSLLVLKEVITKPLQRGGCVVDRNNYLPTISDYCNSRCKRWSLTILHPGLTHNVQCTTDNRKQNVSMDNLSKQSSLVWYVLPEFLTWHCPAIADNLPARKSTDRLSRSIHTLPFIEAWKASMN